MALPTSTDCKSYLGIEDSSHDTLIGNLLTRAKAFVESHIGYPLTAASRTMTLYEGGDVNQWTPRDSIVLPGPIATSPAPTLTDADGDTVPTTEYTVDSRFGMLRSAIDHTFASGPYTLVGTIGLSAHPDYSSRHEPLVSQGIIEIVAHWFQNRNPAASSESDEGGNSVAIREGAIPLRILETLDRLPGASVRVRA